MVRLLLHNALRVDEACTADVTDLGEDSGHRVLPVVRKGARKAKIPLTPATVAALDAYLADRAGGQSPGQGGAALVDDVHGDRDPGAGRQLAAATDLLAAARKRSRAVLASASGTRRPALPSPNGGMFP